MLKIKQIKKGSQLRRFREALGLSQENFGRIIDYSLNRISLIERTNMDLPYKVKKSLDRSWKDLEKFIK